MKLAAVAVLTVALAAPASALSAPQLGAPVMPTAAASTAAATGAASTTASDTTTPLNVASDHAALSAYASYLSALVRSAPTAQVNEVTYVASVSSECRSALAPLTQQSSSPDSATQDTLTALGKEIGDDVSITFDQTALLPFARLQTTLQGLRWTHLSGGNAIVKRFLTTENAVLTFVPSNLCQNALAAYSLIEDSAVQPIPQATRTFNKAYAKASAAANTSLVALLKLMQTYETSSEKSQITRIANLASQVTKLTKSSLESTSSSLTAALES